MWILMILHFWRHAGYIAIVVRVIIAMELTWIYLIVLIFQILAYSQNIMGFEFVINDRMNYALIAPGDVATVPVMSLVRLLAGKRCAIEIESGGLYRTDNWK